MKYLQRLLAVLLLAPALVGTALAEEHGHHRDHERDRRPEWHGEIGRFHEHDIDRWGGGRWHQGRHEGRYGWWWIVGAVWYFYPTRVEPYPDPYQPPVVALPPPPAPPQYWYYCANPAGYYPYVPQCASGWQRVVATPAPR